MYTITQNTTPSIEIGIIGSTGKLKTGLTVTYSVRKTSDNSVLTSGTCTESAGVYYFTYNFTTVAEYRVVWTTPAGYQDGVDTIMVITPENNLAQADIRTAIGLASANLDTQLSTIDTVVDAVKVKTDQLAFTSAGKVDANALMTVAPTDMALNSTVAKEATINTKIPIALSFTGANVNADSKVTAAPSNMALDSTVAKDATVSKPGIAQTISSNADITAIKAKTDNLPADPASNTQVNTRMATFSYTAPDNTTIGTINTKLGTPASTVSADIAAVKSDTGDIVTTLSTLVATIWGYGSRTLTSGLITVASVWDYLLTSITTAGSVGKLIKDDIDATISSRLAGSSYTAPSNVDVAAIKAKTDNLPSTPASQGDVTTAVTNINLHTDSVVVTIPSDVIGELETSTTDIAKRLREVATVQTTGDQLAALNV